LQIATNAAATRLARRLRQAGARPGAFVALLLERTELPIRR
jgi:hypothetical protein